MKTLTEDTRSTVRFVTEIVIAVGVIALVSLSAYKIAVSTPEQLDSITLLTAASLALFIIAFLISVLAVIGWRDLIMRVREEVQVQEKGSRQEYLGWLKMTTGLFFGRMCRTNYDDRIEINRRDLLELALTYTREAYELLKDTPMKWSVINNLAFYMALDGHPANGPTAQQLAVELRNRHSLTHELEFLNTYAKVVAAYSVYFDDPNFALQEAQGMLQALLDSGSATEYDKKNARRHLEVINRALQR